MLNQKSTIESLNLCDYQVDISESISNLIEHFKANPNFPGVLLFKGNRFLGAISQKGFWQYMSRPYSLELSAKRKVEDLLGFFETKHLIVSKDSLIIEATEKALQRSPDLLDQPIVIKLTNRRYRLLDTHQLLVGYAEIHRSTSRLVEETNRKLEETNLELKRTLRLDRVTGFGNRLLFEEYFEREWEQAIQEKSWLSVIRFDLDIFYEERANYSQLAINGCLRKVGSSIAPLLDKANDIAIHYGDGRFAIVLPNSNTIDATVISEKIAKAVQNLKISNSQNQISKNLSLNLGIASIKPREKDDSEQLLMAAEESLEKAKIMGKNCKMIKDISYSELKTESKLPALNSKDIKPILNKGSVVPLKSDRREKKVSQAVS